MSKDNWQTPEIALKYLDPYINKRDHFRIWESACGEGYIVKHFRDRRFDVIATDAKTGKDFFSYYPLSFDIQITNPPYSLMDAWLKRSFKFDRPFALLLPIYALHSKERCELYRKYKIQLIIPPHRIAFIKPPRKEPKKGDAAPWAAVWVTRKLGLESDMIYCESLEDSG